MKDEEFKKMKRDLTHIYMSRNDQSSLDGIGGYEEEIDEWKKKSPQQLLEADRDLGPEAVAQMRLLDDIPMGPPRAWPTHQDVIKYVSLSNDILTKFCGLGKYPNEKLLNQKM
jgi:hypothetical protein